ELASQVEAEGRLAGTNEGIEGAKDLQSQQDKGTAAQTRAAQQRKDLEAEAQRLAQEAAQPGADPKDAATKGRKVAGLAMKTRGSW
ncbi:hypothetical protein, partial [Kitasatospora arboriphila]|uniref:hypothetical protein n=1 Tax=Kitasatospora arboriphila TaxID=258052 RepID=UPI0031E32A74